MTRISVLLAACTLLACDPTGPSEQPSDPKAQPGATLLPLETARPSTPDGGLATRTDAGTLLGDAAPPAPQPFNAYESLAADRPPPTISGAILEARWVWSGDDPAPPEETRKTIESLRVTGARWTIRVGGDRIRAEINSRGQPFPKGTALTARADHYGNLLVWPNGTRYRVLAPGTLRNTFGERRVDVTPLAQGTPEIAGTSEQHGKTTRRVRLSSAIGEIEIELASMPTLGRAASLVCRLLVEAVGIDPATEACAGNELALSANVSWYQPGGAKTPGVRFEVYEIKEEQEFAGAPMSVPPSRARVVRTGLPGKSSTVFLSEEELKSLRGVSTSPAMPPPEGAPETGIVANNQGDQLLFLIVDGIVVAAIPPWQQVALPALRSTRYSMKWRSFWGNVSTSASEVDLPTRWSFGTPPSEKTDAG